jgi:hypothetical protein
LGHGLKKATGSEEREVRRVAAWAEAGKIIGTGLPKPFRAYIHHHVPWILDMEL